MLFINMKKVLLDTYLGKKVKIVLFDDTVCEGELHKVGDYFFMNDPSLYISPRYFCINSSPQSEYFKYFHVKEVEVLN